MNRKIRQLKLEFFYLRRAFFEYKKLGRYLYNRFFLAPQILKSDKIFEKPINNSDLSIHLLTCHRDLIMTIWSLKSFYKVAREVGQLYVHDDDSLTAKDKKIINKFFPKAIIVEPREVLKKNYLAQYPLMKKFRENEDYFLLKKIIDTYFLSDKRIHLIIDSDLLWFETPEEVMAEIKNDCQNSLMMANNSFSHVYFKQGEELAMELANYNSGIVLYKKDNFDLPKMEEYLSRVDEQNKKNAHFIEQGGFAFCLHNLKKLDEKKYIIKEMMNEETVVKHYTSPRRPLFYIEGLEKIKKL